MWCATPALSSLLLLSRRTDYTAAAILEQFGQESTANAVERIMKTLATMKAKRLLEVRSIALYAENTI